MAFLHPLHELSENINFLGVIPEMASDCGIHEEHFTDLLVDLGLESGLQAATCGPERLK